METAVRDFRRIVMTVVLTTVVGAFGSEFVGAVLPGWKQCDMAWGCIPEDPCEDMVCGSCEVCEDSECVPFTPQIDTVYIPTDPQGYYSGGVYYRKHVVTTAPIKLRGSANIVSIGGSISINHPVTCERPGGGLLDGGNGVNGLTQFTCCGDPPGNEPTIGQPGQPGHSLTLITRREPCGLGGGVSIGASITLRGGNGGNGGNGDLERFSCGGPPPGWCCPYDEYIPAQDGQDGGHGAPGGDFTVSSVGPISVGQSSVIDTSGGTGGNGGNGGYPATDGTPESAEPHGCGGSGGFGGSGALGGSISIRHYDAAPSDAINILGGLVTTGGSGGSGGNGGGYLSTQVWDYAEYYGWKGGDGGEAGIGNNGGAVTVEGQVVALVGGIHTSGGSGGAGGHGGVSAVARRLGPAYCEGVGALVSEKGGQGGNGWGAGSGGDVNLTAWQDGTVAAMAIVGSIVASGGNAGNAGDCGGSGGIGEFGGDWEILTPFPGRDGHSGFTGGYGGNVSVVSATPGLINFNAYVIARGGDGADGGAAGSALPGELGGFGGNGGHGGSGGDLFLLTGAGTINILGGGVELYGGSGGDGGDGGTPGGFGGHEGDATWPAGLLHTTGTVNGQIPAAPNPPTDGTPGYPPE